MKQKFIESCLYNLEGERTKKKQTISGFIVLALSISAFLFSSSPANIRVPVVLIMLYGSSILIKTMIVNRYKRLLEKEE
ncbi:MULTISPECIES: hypothetical protein [Bacillaceae]|uniref:hypothetical protein n=1 Tax=Bacillaceae TaxID=186817 RepID=UPI00101D869B|nr:hypothetical protein [Ectobacillus funiculus]